MADKASEWNAYIDKVVREAIAERRQWEQKRQRQQRQRLALSPPTRCLARETIWGNWVCDGCRISFDRDEAFTCPRNLEPAR